jgi:hypothetical protein
MLMPAFFRSLSEPERNEKRKYFLYWLKKINGCKGKFLAKSFSD